MRTLATLEHPKISAAIISLGVLAFAFFAFILAGDMFKAPIWFDRPYAGFVDIGYYVVYPFDSLFVVGLFAVPLVFWHFCDVIDREWDDGREPILTSYRPVFACLIAGMIGSGIVFSGLTEWLSCYEAHLENADGDNFVAFCTPTPGALSEFLVFPFLLALWLLALTKVGTFISRKL
ncbi:MAG: hypothetical protein AAGJ51_12860 [Pseudomonadota bacterium]